MKAPPAPGCAGQERDRGVSLDLSLLLKHVVPPRLYSVQLTQGKSQKMKWNSQLKGSLELSIKLCIKKMFKNTVVTSLRQLFI